MNERKTAWVRETVARMRNAEKNDPTSVGAVIVNNEKVIVTITKNIDNPRIGVAMVSGNDTFDLDTGLAIAYTKAKGQELPCFITCDGCDDEDEWDDEDEDEWDDDEDNDNDEDEWDDEDEDDNEDDDIDTWDDDNRYVPFEYIEIGGKFIDNGSLYIKVNKEQAYYCDKQKLVDFTERYEVDYVVD